MKKVLIVPFNTDLNRGDQALVWETARIIRSVYVEAVDIHVLESGYNENEIKRQSSQSEKKGLKLCDPILHHPGRYWVKDSSEHVSNGIIRIIRWGCVAFVDFFKSYLLLSHNNWINKLGYFFLQERAKYTLGLMKEVDCVFVKGGGFIHAYGKITDAYQLYYSMFAMMLAKRYGKKIFIMPNSFGPLKGRLCRMLVSRLLRKCEFISVREELSYRFLRNEMQISCVKYPDLGYFLEDVSLIDENQYMGKALGTGKPIVGLTLRPWRFPEAINSEERYRNYISVFSAFIGYLNERGYFVCLFVHTLGPSAHENDELALNDVMTKVNEKSNIEIVKDESLNCYDVMRLYSKCSFFVGTRFHSVIFSQNQNIPTLAISYGGNKGNGIMEDIGLSRFVINISSVDLNLLKEKFEDLEKEVNAYCDALKLYRKSLLQEREFLVKEIKKIL